MRALSCLLLVAGCAPIGALYEVGTIQREDRQRAAARRAEDAQRRDPDVMTGAAAAGYRLVTSVPLRPGRPAPLRVRLKMDHCYALALRPVAGAPAAGPVELRFGFQRAPDDWDFDVVVRRPAEPIRFYCSVSRSLVLVHRRTTGEVGPAGSRLEIREKRVEPSVATRWTLRNAALRGRLRVGNPRCDACQARFDACMRGDDGVAADACFARRGTCRQGCW